eukprot:4444002-Lingulodinium_polyedra.AAC.1
MQDRCWIATGSEQARILDRGQPAPFQLRKRKTCPLQIGLQQRERLRPGADTDKTKPSILAVAALSTAYAYDHSKRLAFGERHQYQHWVLNQGLRAQDLWYWRIDEWQPLTSPAPLAETLHRQTARVWRA